MIPCNKTKKTNTIQLDQCKKEEHEGQDCLHASILFSHDRCGAQDRVVRVETCLIELVKIPSIWRNTDICKPQEPTITLSFQRPHGIGRFWQHSHLSINLPLTSSINSVIQHALDSQINISVAF